MWPQLRKLYIKQRMAWIKFKIHFAMKYGIALEWPPFRLKDE